ncbi:uncharacterized protein E5676_scaffold49G00920 [Cucumis melo var. makuwa]|uniref:Uncharacterized protein n=1 Tax=Cucumis melo var. makuwa TaxID=1194695 RepID=A0A5A7STG6_CUCMM|nr:uncharacterized protein E6C27_scaffold43059G001090 [Cucumis melo var. makuwa]TYK01299.1 uncharacterized protein E5676_scaffold49G00920 [Cucumis melo var. makuwa]
MSRALTPRSSAYLSALSQQIEKKLQRALASSSQRRDVLQELFADIALEVDDRAKEIILSTEEDAIAPVEHGMNDPLCFYDVLADYYVQVPESGKPILDLIVKLWSQSFTCHIFTLLFHKWLFEIEIENSDEVHLRNSSALVQGAANIFWLDIQANTTRFKSLFHYLLEEVAFQPARLNKIPIQVQRDLFLLLSRFLIFYDSDDKLESFLKQFPPFPNAILVGGPADLFVIELTDQFHNGIKILRWSDSKVEGGTCTAALSFTPDCSPRYGTQNDHKYKAKNLFVQLYLSRWSHVPNQSCSTCCVGCTGFAVPSWTIS